MIDQQQRFDAGKLRLQKELQRKIYDLDNAKAEAYRVFQTQMAKLTLECFTPGSPELETDA